MVKNCRIVKWPEIPMQFEYWTKFSPVFKIALLLISFIFHLTFPLIVFIKSVSLFKPRTDLVLASIKY